MKNESYNGKILQCKSKTFGFKKEAFFLRGVVVYMGFWGNLIHTDLEKFQCSYNILGSKHYVKRELRKDELMDLTIAYTRYSEKLLEECKTLDCFVNKLYRRANLIFGA